MLPVSWNITPAFHMSDALDLETLRSAGRLAQLYASLASPMRCAFKCEYSARPTFKGVRRMVGRQDMACPFQSSSACLP